MIGSRAAPIRLRGKEVVLRPRPSEPIPLLGVVACLHTLTALTALQSSRAIDPILGRPYCMHHKETSSLASRQHETHAANKVHAFAR